MVGGFGLSQGERLRLSARIVDDAASRLPCPRAWTYRRTCVSRQPGAGHGLQNPRPGRGKAAQSPLLSGAPRPRLRGQNGTGAVRLSPSETLEKDGGPLEAQLEWRGRRRLLADTHH